MSILPAVLLPLISRALEGKTPNNPSSWNNSPAAQIPDLNSLQTYINRQDTNQEQKNKETEQLIASSPDISSMVDDIIANNRKSGIAVSSANDFKDVNLLYHPNAHEQDKYTGGLSNQPDGFRIFLIKPKTPNVEGLLTGAGNMVGIAGDKIQELTNEAAKAPIVGGIVENIPFVDQIGKTGQTVKGYLTEKGRDFTQSVEKYTNVAYEQYAGNANAFYSAILPMPKNLTDQHSHEVDQLMLGFLPRVLSTLGAGFASDGKGFGKKTAGRSGGVISDAASAIGGGIGRTLATGAMEMGAYAYQLGKARVGVGLNPNVETLYSAPRIRNWTFNFQFYPKNPAEVSEIRDFIKRIKEHSYPISVLGIAGQNQLYVYPGQVYFEFSGRYKDKLFKSLRPCIITNIQIDYSDGEQYQHFRDGSSIVYNLTLELTETRLLDRNILADDAEQEFKNNRLNSFANEDYRNSLAFNNTFAGKEIDDFLNRQPTPSNNIPPNIARPGQ